MASNESATRRRVKLYMLNEDRQWDDKGTGHVSSSFVEAQKGIALIVISECDGSVLLESKIQCDTAYQKQQETLVVWSEGDNVDLALSFQEKAGCEEIWSKICSVQGKDPSVDITQEVVDESEGEDAELENSGCGGHSETGFDLPPAEFGNLKEILDVIISTMSSAPKRERLAMALEQPGYLHRLFEDIFRGAEDLEDNESLHHLHEILRNILMLNKDSLCKILFANDLIMDVIGVLEYDPARPTRTRHRDFLNCKAMFREVLPLHSVNLQAKIHQTYRVQYIQDCILPTPSLFEENVLSTLNSFIFFNKVEITTAVMEDDKIMSQLFAHLMEKDLETSRRRDLVCFLKELCTFSQTLQVNQRDIFFKTLLSFKALRAVTVTFGCGDDGIQSYAMDILSYFIDYSPSMVRDYMLAEANEQPPRGDDDLLINIMIEQMSNDTDPELGGALQLCGLIRLIIDPDNMMATNNSYSRVLLQRTEKTEFLVFFYKRVINVLAAPLFTNTVSDGPLKDDYRTALLLQYLLEIIAFCIERHTYHMKNYVLSKDLVKRVLVLLKSRHTFLVLGALRLFRRVVGLKEEFYNRYLTKNCLFRPILDLFHSNGHRYNLLNSALIELFEFIRQEDIRSLITHTVENHWPEIKHINYVNTFKGLKMRYEQIQDRVSRIALGVGGGSSSSAAAGFDMVVENGSFPSAFGSTFSSVAANNRFQRDPRSLEEDEESWFDADDDVDLETDVDSQLPDVIRNTVGGSNSVCLASVSSTSTEKSDASLLVDENDFRGFLDRNVAASGSAGDNNADMSGVLEKDSTSYHRIVRPTSISIHLKTNSTQLQAACSTSAQHFPASDGSNNNCTSKMFSTLPQPAASLSSTTSTTIGSLVDYDEDSDEEEEEEVTSSSMCDEKEPQSKRRRTNSAENPADTLWPDLTNQLKSPVITNSLVDMTACETTAAPVSATEQCV